MAGSGLDVTCVIPVFDGERYLGEAIESVLRQTRPPVEVVVVDDGSADRSAEVARAFGPRLTVVRQENAGPAAARNRGIALARGDLVAFTDADDVWLKEKLERQVARFEARPDLDICLVHARNFLSPDVAADAAGAWTGGERARFLDTPWPSPLSALARRGVFESRGVLFDPAAVPGEAPDWYERALAAGAAAEVIEDVLVLRRIHRDNLTRRAPRAAAEGALHRIKAMLDRKRR